MASWRDRLLPRRRVEIEAGEADLIRRSQKGEQVAFEQLVRRYQTKVFSIIANLLRGSHDVEDVAQQVFLKLYFALPNFRFHATLGTFLYRITVNECYDYLRKQRTREPVSAELTEEQAQKLESLEDERAVSGRTVTERIELKETVERLLRRLSPEERILLTLKEIEGLSIEEIARIVEMNENTVKVKLFRARAKLARRLGGRRR